MSDPGQPVTASEETLALLVHDFETGESGREIEDLAGDLGVTPPDDREGWSIVYRYGPDGEALGLTWLHPYDEPIQQID